ncbi:MAG: hypothetical protein ABI040_00935 [Rhodoferax sp.]
MRPQQRVRAVKPDIDEPVRIVRVDDEARIQSAIGKRVDEIAAESSDSDKTAHIYVLGRYNRDDACVPLNYDSSRIEVKFITMHSSKGVEVDHIILPRVASETLGFQAESQTTLCCNSRCLEAISMNTRRSGACPTWH